MRAFLFVLTIVGLVASAPEQAYAAASCNCQLQPNGTLWCLCVTDAGAHICYSCPAGSSDYKNCSKIKC